MSNTTLTFVLIAIGLVVLAEWFFSDSFGDAICGTMGLGIGLLFYLLQPENNGE